MTDRQRPWPADIDVRTGKTLKLNGTANPAEADEPITRRIPVQSVAKQRIILLARDVRARLSSSAIARSLGESTLRGMTDINETLERLSAPKPPKARAIDYRGVDPFKAEVARALGRTEVCHAPPADALPAFAELSEQPAGASTPSAEKSEAEVSPFAQTTEFYPPPELEHLLHLHEETRRSLADTEPAEDLELDPEEPASDEPKRPSSKLMLGAGALLALSVVGNWPLSTQMVQAHLAGYSGAHQLPSAVTGHVAKVLVAVGDHVTAGQPVLQLEERAPLPALPAEQPSVEAQELAQLLAALHAGETRVEAQRGVLATLEAKRDRLMEAETAAPAKLSAIDDLVDSARGQLRALESALLQTRQALEAKQPVRLRDVTAEQPEAASSAKATHGGVVVQVLTVPGAAIQPDSPILSMLGDAAVPALVVSCNEQEAELLLESPEVMLSVHDTKLTVLVTRLVDSAEGQASDDDRRAVELALQDAAQLAELARHAEIGMPVVIELPEQRTLLSRTSRWLRHEFQ